MRIGYACMRHPQPEEHKISTTTLAALRRLPRAAALAKVQALAELNAQRLLNHVEHLGRAPASQRLLRVGSGLWPMADHPEYAGAYSLQAAEDGLAWVGRRARELDVWLSSHPPAFNVLATPNATTLENTIVTLDMAGHQCALMGATNMVVHCWGTLGTEVFQQRSLRLSAEARARLVVENDEFGVGTQQLLDSPTLSYPVVLDPHHHWIRTGQWPGAEVYAAVRATWPVGRRPKIHYSYPRTSEAVAGVPEWTGNRTHMRAHHDVLPNLEMNEFVLAQCAANGFDIMVEAKHKDVASTGLWQQALQLGYVTAAQ